MATAKKIITSSTSTSTCLHVFKIQLNAFLKGLCHVILVCHFWAKPHPITFEVQIEQSRKGENQGEESLSA